MTPETFLVFARALPEPMALVDVGGQVLAANPACVDFPAVSIAPGVVAHLRRAFAGTLLDYLAACQGSRSHRQTDVAAARAPTAASSTCAAKASSVPAAEGEALILLRLRSRDSAAREVALHAAEARYRAMVENAVHGICRCRVDGIVARCQPRAGPVARRTDRRGPARRQPARRGLRRSGGVPHAGRSRAPRRPRAERRRQLDALRRHPIAVRRERPLRSHRSAAGGDILELLVEDATERRIARGAARAGAEDGVGRAASPAASRTTSTTC